MRKNMEKFTRDLLNCYSLILLGSAVIDSFLWIETQYLIPAWTIAVMSVGMFVMVQVILRLRK